jgi:dihydroorotate dehydrogenase electron transfer subunit
MKVEQAQVVRHDDCTEAYSRIVLKAPEIAARVQPGQFVHLRVLHLQDAVLRRPFSVFMADNGTISILYKCVGKGTRALKEVAVGEEVSLLGPLGNGFPLELDGTYPVLVAGGYGVAPLYLLAERLAVEGTVFIGGAGEGDILCGAEFDTLGWDVRVATEDGSCGSRGLVTDILDAWLADRAGTVLPEFFACGPDGMLRAVGERAIAAGRRAWLSLDKHMGCGMGACLACVQRIRHDDGSETWERVCRDGPVFEARQIVWQ